MKPSGMRNLFKASLLAVCVGLAASAQATPPKKFTIYVFLPWQVQMPDGNIDRSIKLEEYVAQFGLKPANVIYDARYLTNGKPDVAKITALAQATHADPDAIVSFDTEFGDRTHPETVVPEVLDILQIYKAAQPKAKVGVYATVPQNTYGWKPGIEKFDALNARYQAVAKAVDVLSPVLYNYDFDNADAWLRAATYSVNAAKKYGTNKPIIPYIDTNYGAIKAAGHASNPVIQLSEREMTTHLQKLYELGASGCIVWGSSGARDANGKQPVFDASTGWAKALVAFAKSHR